MIYWAVLDKDGKCVECPTQECTPHLPRALGLTLARYDSFGERESVPVVQNYRRKRYAQGLEIEVENDDSKQDEYQLKAIQAQQVADNPEIDSAAVPLIALEATVNSSTLQIEADRVLAKIAEGRAVVEDRAKQRIMKRMKSREILGNPDNT